MSVHGGGGSGEARTGSTAQAWWHAARPLAQGNLAPALVYGQALAYSATGHFDLATAALVQLFGVVDHLFIVFANDVADADSDAQNGTFNLFSGGSRVLPEGRLTRRALARAAWGMAAATLAVAAVLAWRAGRPALVALGVAALALMHAYSFRPLRLSYRGGGEILQGLGIGVVLPLVGLLGQWPRDGVVSAAVAWPMLTALVPTFLLGVAGNVTTALPDAPSDAATGKRTWPVRRGERTARRDAVALVGLGVACVPSASPSLGLASLAVMIPPLSLLMANVRALDDADAKHRAACLRFVARNGVAIGYTLAAWAVALVVTAR